MSKLPTVTIGIPAYNEERNIGALIQSAINQDQSNYRLDRIIIVLDGSNNKTRDVVKSFTKNNEIVKYIYFEKRKGKATRVDYIHKQNTSDFLITLDADTKLAGNHSISEVIKKFENKNVGLVGGNNIPLKPRSFFEKIAVSSFYLWYEPRTMYKKGNTLHTHHSCISALKGTLCKSINLPSDCVEDDDYIFFRVKELGFEYAFAKDAVTIFREPTTLVDYLSQSIRFLNSKKKIGVRFGPWVKLHYKIPFGIKLLAILNRMLKDPVFTTLAILLQLILRLVFLFQDSINHNSGWEPAKSTKLSLSKS